MRTTRGRSGPLPAAQGGPGRPGRRRAVLVAFAVVALAVLGRSLVALATTEHYLAINEKAASGGGAGCADVAWAAGRGLLSPVEVRWLGENGIRCPDGTLDREAAHSEQYVVMAALGAQGQLTCDDVEWNAVRGYVSRTGLANLAGGLGCRPSAYAWMISLLASERLTCADIAWHLAHGGLTRLQATWLAAVVPCDWAEIEPPLRPAGRVVTYQVAVRGQPAADVEEFRRLAAETLADPRGWRRGGAVFVEVPEGGDVTLWLAQAESLPSFGPPCSASWSCQSGRDVIINDLRWREASPSWGAAGGSLRDYRHMVVNHEMGHWLGSGHLSCGGGGQPAPVMQQQSIDLQGCTFNAWPLAGELALVG